MRRHVTHNVINTIRFHRYAQILRTIFRSGARQVNPYHRVPTDCLQRLLDSFHNRLNFTNTITRGCDGKTATIHCCAGFRVPIDTRIKQKVYVEVVCRQRRATYHWWCCIHCQRLIRRSRYIPRRINDI